MMTKAINLKVIRTDGGTQSRAEINENIVDEYANAMNDGAIFPPPLLFFDGTEYWLAAGFHRVAAAKLAGKASITVELRPGSRFDAVVWSVGENAEHGLRRNNADKRNAVLVLLAEAGASTWSDGRVAECCKVTRQFVSDVRKPELRAARDEKAKATNGHKAKPATGEGDVKIASPQKKAKGVATVATRENPENNEPTENELRDEDPQRILREENERLSDRLACEALDATEEERSLAYETISELRRSLLVVTAERDAMSKQFKLYISENNELKGEVKRLRKKLDQALAKA
jgi:regulator of replication initiation timing